MRRVETILLFTLMSLLCRTANITSSTNLPFDRGIGFITLKEKSSCNIYSDSLLSKLKDRFIEDAYIFNFLEVSNQDLINSGIFEYGYERFGLPIISLSKSKIKVLLPKDENNFEYGYISLDTTKINITYWPEILPSKALFFEERSDHTVYKWIKGQEIKIDLINSKDYVIHPQEIKGNWMRVKIIIPSDECKYRVNGDVINGWIMYLNDNNRPNVWYYPRGC